ncbi:MAG: Gfo/Idh/MocA family oxidoreductase [Clostridia bacterium]|nr:Gfo/Idh/MocA family oxidoreductase [Clostridia bacterium]
MYNYAIIGFGGLGKLHLSNLVKIEKERGDIKLQAICGADKQSFKENVKINLGTVDLSEIDIDNCNFYQDYKEMIDNEKIDFILSTLPTFLHKEVCIYALKKGIHVFSEKPFALTIDDCIEMIETAKQNEKKLMIGHCLRFDSAFSKLKEYVDNKTFGKVYRAEFTRYSQLPKWTWNNWVLDPLKSGGAILDLHIHDVDIINWIFGAPKSIYCTMTNNKAKQESVFAQFYYDDLLIISNADWSMTQTFPFEAKCLVNFEEATIVIKEGKLFVYKDGESFVESFENENCFMNEIRAFLELVIDNKPCDKTSPESVLESMKIAMRELDAAKSGERIVL